MLAGLQSMLLHNHSCSVAALNSLPTPTLLVVISHLKPGPSRCLLGLLPELAQGALSGPASCMFLPSRPCLSAFSSPCRLVSPDILRLVHNGARMVYVGKQRGYHTRTQTEVRTSEFRDWLN